MWNLMAREIQLAGEHIHPVRNYCLALITIEHGYNSGRKRTSCHGFI